ncbi:MAG: hypothetical protein M3063_12355, partial [Actinomycetota bacterium]|nr:hypothetical protein [Actinomycetota bacterium]
GPAGAPSSAAPAGAPSSAAPEATTTTVQPPFALTVVTRDGKLAFPPTVSLIPVVNGRMPPSPGSSKVTGRGAVPGPVIIWAQDQFGAKGVQPPQLQLGLDGEPTVEASWNPDAGGTVYRLKVNLDSLAPGTAESKLIANSQTIDAKVRADAIGVQADQAALSQAQAQARAAQQAAATAVPPNPPPLAAAVGAANATAASASQKLTADMAVLTADQAAEAKAAPASEGVTKVAAVATYDVWMRAQAVVGWAPAAYGVTG